MSTKPAVVLVHGFWGGAAHWANVIVELDRRGYSAIHAVENPLTSLADDVERTSKMVRQIDGPVLLVGHSYGGVVITEAGNLPNVVGLVYVAAFAPTRARARAAEPADTARGVRQHRPGLRRLPVDRPGCLPRQLLPGPRGRGRAGHGHHPEGAAAPPSATPSPPRRGGPGRAGTSCPPRTG